MTTFDLTQKSITKNSLTKLSLTQMWYSHSVLIDHKYNFLARNLNFEKTRKTSISHNYNDYKCCSKHEKIEH